MLKLTDPRLNADVLHALAPMGHGDVIVVADANFPAASTAAHTPYRRLLRLDNLTLGEALEAILSLMPLDSLVDDAACRMRVDGQPDELPPVQREAQQAIVTSGEAGHTLAGLDRTRSTNAQSRPMRSS